MNLLPPPHQRRDAAKVAHESFSSRFDDFERRVKVFESSGILRRYLVRPLDWGAQAVSAAAALCALLAESRPGSCVLVVAVELCSVAFRIDKLTKENIIATALFSDDAACRGQPRAARAAA